MPTATSTYPDIELQGLVRARVDERAARATLRRQVARLEHELASLVVDLWHAGRTRPPPATPMAQVGPRLLTLGELEEIRDGLLVRIDRTRAALTQRAEEHRAARAHLDQMLTDPARYRFHVVSRAELGEPSCGAYQVRPRLGLLGMLFGWWCVKLSSGCPLSRVPPEQIQ